MPEIVGTSSNTVCYCCKRQLKKAVVLSFFGDERDYGVGCAALVLGRHYGSVCEEAIVAEQRRNRKSPTEE